MKNSFSILGGITVGICIGLLIAPTTGSEARKKVSETTSDLIEKLRNIFISEEKSETALGKKSNAQRHTSGATS
jgi:gas vesicle protein